MMLFDLGWRRSIVVSAGELSLSCARLDGWPVCGYAVRYWSDNMANSAFHPSGVG